MKETSSSIKFREKDFHFDEVYSSKIEDQQRYPRTVFAPLLEKFTNGENCSMFFYGLSEAWKVYHNRDELDSCLKYFVENLFETMRRKRVVFFVRMSLLEFDGSNQEVYDLLDNGGGFTKKALTFKEGSFLENIMTKKITCVDDFTNDYSTGISVIDFASMLSHIQRPPAEVDSTLRLQFTLETGDFHSTMTFFELTGSENASKMKEFSRFTTNGKDLVLFQKIIKLFSMKDEEHLKLFDETLFTRSLKPSFTHPKVFYFLFYFLRNGEKKKMTKMTKMEHDETMKSLEFSEELNKFKKRLMNMEEKEDEKERIEFLQRVPTNKHNIEERKFQPSLNVSLSQGKKVKTSKIFMNLRE